MRWGKTNKQRISTWIKKKTTETEMENTGISSQVRVQSQTSHGNFRWPAAAGRAVTALRLTISAKYVTTQAKVLRTHVKTFLLLSSLVTPSQRRPFKQSLRYTQPFQQLHTPASLPHVPAEAVVSQTAHHTDLHLNRSAAKCRKMQLFVKWTWLMVQY